MVKHAWKSTAERVRLPYALSEAECRQASTHSVRSQVAWECSLKRGGILHLRLNIDERPIANKYREGKMKRTLKREFKELEVVEMEGIWSTVLLLRIICSRTCAVTCVTVDFLNIEVYWERLKRGLKGSVRVYDMTRFLTLLVLGSSSYVLNLTPVASLDRENIALFVIKHCVFENSEWTPIRID